MIGTFAPLKCIIDPKINDKNLSIVLRFITRINPEFQTKKLKLVDLQKEGELYIIPILENKMGINFGGIYINYISDKCANYSNLFISKDSNVFIIPKINRIYAYEYNIITIDNKDNNKVKMKIGKDTNLEFNLKKNTKGEYDIYDVKVHFYGEEFKSFKDTMAKLISIYIRQSDLKRSRILKGNIIKIENKIKNKKFEIKDITFDLVRIDKHENGNDYITFIAKFKLKDIKQNKVITTPYLTVYISKDIHTKKYLLAISGVNKTYIAYYDNDFLTIYEFNIGMAFAYSKGFALVKESAKRPFITIVPDYETLNLNYKHSECFIETYEIDLETDVCFYDTYFNKKCKCIYIMGLPQFLANINSRSILFLLNDVFVDHHTLYKKYDIEFSAQHNYPYFYYIPPILTQIIKH
ncbi:hypothetical protein [Methanocaldococcus sp.]